MQATALPGKVALKISPELLDVVNSRCKKTVIVTGTNGKTTTNNLINHILNAEFHDVLSNLRGANMHQGVVSSFLNDLKDEYDWGVFEVDEGSVPEVVKYIKPDYFIVTNFFRDQLDRFGEIEYTAKIVYEAIKELDTTLILNADNPMVSKFKDLKKRNIFYGVKKSSFSTMDQRIVESRFCPVCSNSLDYEYYNYGQLGKYHCSKCGFENPEYDYSVSTIEQDQDGYHFDVEYPKGSAEHLNFKYDGIYNVYNCCAAIGFSIEAGIDIGVISERLENFDYKLGRMENFVFEDKIVKIVLVKNPIGLSEVLKSIAHDNRKKSILFILNDNPADGRDVSWIWDADVETVQSIENLESIYCSGIRAPDIALRLKYAEIDQKIFEIDLDIESSIGNVLNEESEIIYILPTYTAVYLTRDIVMNHLTNSNARVSRIREMIKSRVT